MLGFHCHMKIIDRSTNVHESNHLLHEVQLAATAAVHPNKYASILQFSQLTETITETIYHFTEL